MRHHWMAALLAVSLPVQAQVCVTGVVQPVGPTICMQGETHVLEGSSVFLRSSAINLAQYEGQLVRVTGADVGLVCHVLDVVAVYPALARLEACGTPMPGCPLLVRIEPGAIGRYAIFVAFGAGYQPLGCAPPSWLDGTILVGTPAVALATGVFPGPSGDFLWQIPNLPALAGIELWFQGARQDIGPVGPVQLSNVLHVRLVPFMPPCGPLNC